MAHREVIAGAVRDLHERDAEATIPQPTLPEMLADIRKLALEAMDERNEAVRLLRHTLTLREIGSEGPHKSEIRTFLARLGLPPTRTRFERQLALEREIVSFNPDTVEALELLHSFHRALVDRYGEERTTDLRARLNEVEEALAEVEA